MSRATTDTSRSTASESVRGYPLETPRTASPQVQKYGLLRDCVSILEGDVADLKDDLALKHRTELDHDLRQRAKIKEKQSASDLLDELSTGRGMSWTDLARIIGVSVAAVRKWRQSGSPTPDNRAALAEIASFLDLLEEYAVNEPAEWLELPVSDRATVTHMDIYEAGRRDLLLDLANQRKSEVEVLDVYDTDWRERYRRDFEVFEGPDGHASIRRRL